jgi:hypothetical protein
MPLRFRRSIRIAPGVRINVGKRSVSTNTGKRGADITLGGGHIRTTIGVPGSGISYIETTPKRTKRRAPVIAILGAAIAALAAWWVLH